MLILVTELKQKYFIFIQDGAQPHGGKIVQEYFNEPQYPYFGEVIV